MTGLCKLFVLVSIAFSFFSSCKKIQDPDSDPTSPNNSSNYFGDIASTFSPGAISARPGQLDSIGYIEDLDTALISPFARINAPSFYDIAMPVPGHQSNYGTTPKNSCVGWVVGYGLMSYIYTQIKGNFTGSPSFVWNQLNGGKDDAVSLADALTGVKENGCCSTAFMGPFVPVNEQPSVLAKESAKHQTIAEFYAMRTMDLAVIKNYLTYGVPMPFLATIDKGFLDGDPASYIKDNDGAYIYKKNSGVVEGKHAMLLVGYDDTKHAFKIMNSRGPDWANGGFAWIDYDMFKTLATTSGGLLNGGMRYNIFWVVPQVVETGLTTAVKATSVLAEGLLLNNAGKIISERGFCWSDVTKFPKALNNHIVNNSGLTLFKSTVIGLMPETKYYLRAYAKMSNGSYHYGEVDSFTTNSFDSTDLYKAALIGRYKQIGAFVPQGATMYLDLHANGNAIYTIYGSSSWADGTGFGATWKVEKYNGRYHYWESGFYHPGYHNIAPNHPLIYSNPIPIFYFHEETPGNPATYIRQ